MKKGRRIVLVTLIQKRARLEAAIAQLQSELRTLNGVLAPLEEEAVRVLENGGRIPGVQLRVTYRRTVSWKSVVEAKLGKAYAEKVLASTKPRKITKVVPETAVEAVAVAA